MLSGVSAAPIQTLTFRVHEVKLRDTELQYLYTDNLAEQPNLLISLYLNENWICNIRVVSLAKELFNKLSKTKQNMSLTNVYNKKIA